MAEKTIFHPGVKDGHFSDQYFNRAKQILEMDGYSPKVRMQIFQRNNDVCVHGIDEVVAVLIDALGKEYKKLHVTAVPNGSIVNAWETVMLIDGPYNLFAHLETIYLGILARGSKVATNTYRCVKAANGKPVLLFNARFDRYENEKSDGQAYAVGCRAAGQEPFGVSTDAQGMYIGLNGQGTMPHALIAAYNGDTVQAAIKFATYMEPNIKRTVLVDFENDCVQTSKEVAKSMYRMYKETHNAKFILSAVRLDTSGTMVDRCIQKDMENVYPIRYVGKTKPTGVTPELVAHVRQGFIELAKSYGDRDGLTGFNYFDNIQIMVSGGFTADKIDMFEHNPLSKDCTHIYGVGSSIYNGNFDFTADIVGHLDMNGNFVPVCKKGRTFIPNHNLEEVK